MTHELGTQSIFRLLLRFSIPSLISNFLFTIYNVVDRVFISWKLGTDAIAGVGITFYLFMIFIAVGMMFGIGGGTLSGLSELITGVHQYALIRKLCQDGDLSQIDLTIGDMSKGKVGTLPPEATAANFAKLAEDATSADKMRGLVNLVLQAIGTMSVLACRTCGTNTVVLTGALTMLPPAHETFELFTQLYGVEYIIPENATFATAIGAALYSMREDG